MRKLKHEKLRENSEMVLAHRLRSIMPQRMILAQQDRKIFDKQGMENIKKKNRQCAQWCTRAVFNSHSALDGIVVVALSSPLRKKDDQRRHIVARAEPQRARHQFARDLALRHAAHGQLAVHVLDRLVAGHDVPQAVGGQNHKQAVGVQLRDGQLGRAEHERVANARRLPLDGRVADGARQTAGVVRKPTRAGEEWGSHESNHQMYMESERWLRNAIFHISLGNTVKNLVEYSKLNAAGEKRMIHCHDLRLWN